MLDTKALHLEAQETAGITLSPAQLEAFAAYASLLVEWSQRMNLTSIRSPAEIRVKHFLDSLSCLKGMTLTGGMCLIDVGTGAGFPGLVFKIYQPGIHLTLVESVGKKTKFCQEVVRQLGLRDVEILTSRAEEVGREKRHREMYDWAVARAVAGLPILVEYLLPLVRVGGRMLAQKGDTAHAELESAANAIRLLGGKAEPLVPVQLPGIPDRRYLVIVRKDRPTPGDYPRRVGLPLKQPL